MYNEVSSDLQNRTISNNQNFTPSQVTLETQACPICNQMNDQRILTGKDRLNNLPGWFTVVKCKSCGLMRTNPRPTPETMGFYYPDDYGPYQSTQVKLNNQEEKDLPVRQTFLEQLLSFDTKERTIPDLKPGKMLEIGCASGSFLDKMAKQGWDVEGIEFSATAAQAARNLGYSVYNGSLETAPTPAELYDLIAGWMVLEHLHDPILCLKKLHQWSKPDAWLVFSVPNAGALDFQVFQKYWYALQLPCHLYHYTPKTIRQVLEKGGWQVESIQYHRLTKDWFLSFAHFLGDFDNPKLEKYEQELFRLIKYRPKIQFLLYPLAYFLSLLGQTSRMTVWARKK